MFGQVLGRWAAGLVILIACGALPPADSSGADTPEADTDEDEQPIDFNAIRMKAEAGHVPSQTMLGDLLANSSDFTNAVIWYRKAAEKGNISAQLSLASLLITGRGTARDPQEAAKWLRQAANGIESTKPVINVGSVAPVLRTNAPAPIVITKASTAPTTNLAVIATQSLAIAARVQRVTALHAPEPVLQDPRPTLRPPAEPR